MSNNSSSSPKIVASGAVAIPGHIAQTPITVPSGVTVPVQMYALMTSDIPQTTLPISFDLPEEIWPNYAYITPKGNKMYLSALTIHLIYTEDLKVRGNQGLRKLIAKIRIVKEIGMALADQYGW